MNNLNNEKNRNTILDKIESDGVNLSEFDKNQKTKIIEMYAVVCFKEGLIG